MEDEKSIGVNEVQAELNSLSLKNVFDGVFKTSDWNILLGMLVSIGIDVNEQKARELYTYVKEEVPTYISLTVKDFAAIVNRYFVLDRA
jgi:hypothetical protein